MVIVINVGVPLVDKGFKLSSCKIMASVTRDPLSPHLMWLRWKQTHRRGACYRPEGQHTCRLELTSGLGQHMKYLLGCGSGTIAMVARRGKVPVSRKTGHKFF